MVQKNESRLIRQSSWTDIYLSVFVRYVQLINIQSFKQCMLLL